MGNFGHMVFSVLVLNVKKSYNPRCQYDSIIVFIEAILFDAL